MYVRFKTTKMSFPRKKLPLLFKNTLNVLVHNSIQKLNKILLSFINPTVIVDTILVDFSDM